MRNKMWFKKVMRSQLLLFSVLLSLSFITNARESSSQSKKIYTVEEVTGSHRDLVDTILNEKTEFLVIYDDRLVVDMGNAIKYFLKVKEGDDGKKVVVKNSKDDVGNAKDVSKKEMGVLGNAPSHIAPFTKLVSHPFITPNDVSMHGSKTRIVNNQGLSSYVGFKTTTENPLKAYLESEENIRGTIASSK